MTAETDAALERLRHYAENFTAHQSALDAATALAEIERWRAEAGPSFQDIDQMITEARAAGYEAGQRAMREKAARAALNARAPMVECWPACKAVEALPILPEPQEGA